MGVLTLEIIQNIFYFDQVNYYFKKIPDGRQNVRQYAQFATFHSMYVVVKLNFKNRIICMCTLF